MLAMMNDALTAAGFSVTGTRDIAELDEALPLAGYVGILTVASLVGPITARSDLPLLDIFPFCRRWGANGDRATDDFLDREAMLARLRAFHRRRRARPVERSVARPMDGAS
ncbi:hypothetical protein GCM10028812_44020 [Ancylobacter sonchi]